MCGRFALYSSKQAIINYYKELVIKGDIKPNYNIAPSLIVPVIINEKGKFILQNIQWGFLPYWSDEKVFINIRAESVATKPSFKNAFLHKRCIIPANGFFEWRKTDKQPFYIKPKEDELFSFAGLWEFSSKSNKKTFGIITVQANDKLKDIHHRMPAIIKKKDEKIWLTSQNTDELLSLLKPLDDDKIVCYQVARAVNKTYVNDEFIIKKVG